METVYVCPNCGRQTIGTIKTGCASVCICQHCLKTGTTVYMQEQKNNDIYSMGDGLFSKKK